MISPIVVCCLRILNCFFRSRLPQENPPSERRKKSWWAVHKHHGCYVNTHVNMYINPCHPMCTHQAAIRASIKGGNLQQSQAQPASAFPVSFVFWAVVSASALIIDVSACIRQAMMVRPGPGRCAELQGGATNWLPLVVWDWLFPERPQKSRKKQRNVYSIYGHSSLLFILLFIPPLWQLIYYYWFQLLQMIISSVLLK